MNENTKYEPKTYIEKTATETDEKKKRLWLWKEKNKIKQDKTRLYLQSANVY